MEVPENVILTGLAAYEKVHDLAFGRIKKKSNIYFLITT